MSHHSKEKEAQILRCRAFRHQFHWCEKPADNRANWWGLSSRKGGSLVTWLIAAICASVLYFHNHAFESRTTSSLAQSPKQTSPYPDSLCLCLDCTFTCTCALNRPQCLTSCCWGKASTPTERDILREMWIIPSIKTLPSKCWDLKSHIHTHVLMWNSQWVDWLMTFLRYQLIQTQRHDWGLPGTLFLIIRKCLSSTIKTSRVYNHLRALRSQTS